MLVMKFGGTSVGCAESIDRVSRIVRERQNRHGASDMNLSFAVDEREAEAVVRSLHLTLFSRATEEQASLFLGAPEYRQTDASVAVEA